MEKIRSHKDLNVYQLAFDSALQIHQISQSFPAEEKYALTDQIRRCSRSVCANMAEAWRKRKYKNHFISKLSDSEAEAAETQVWLDFALAFQYLDNKTHEDLMDRYEHIIAMLINMSHSPDNWIIK